MMSHLPKMMVIKVIGVGQRRWLTVQPIQTAVVLGVMQTGDNNRVRVRVSHSVRVGTDKLLEYRHLLLLKRHFVFG